MRVTNGTEAQLYWRNDQTQEYSEFQSLKMPVIADGSFHTYQFEVGEALAWAGTVTGLRLDPTDQPSEVEIETIRFERLCTTSQGQ